MCISIDKLMNVQCFSTYCLFETAIFEIIIIVIIINFDVLTYKQTHTIISWSITVWSCMCVYSSVCSVLIQCTYYM